MRKMRYPIMKNPGYNEITEELSPLNYSKKFHHLLYWEELQHIEELDKRFNDISKSI